jgi:hypothetical protein
MQSNLRIIPKQFSGKKADVFHKVLSAARELQLGFIRGAVTVNKTLWHLSLGALSTIQSSSFVVTSLCSGTGASKAKSVPPSPYSPHCTVPC